ncbi:enoyl-CoA delta isomerase 2, peroxisomal-like [Rhododendron vialii]|uniref:enoyl-CoA delta isomerase 2, peroxisomal-like n=1 Tax=Rhododendron vialii TaxID=182163 RepID=UPI00265DE7BB|nr:enoyl-CoA delta isomerase 2, peroxisomal-like [Rhododendron vialii]
MKPLSAECQNQENAAFLGKFALNNDSSHYQQPFTYHCYIYIYLSLSRRETKPKKATTVNFTFTTMCTLEKMGGIFLLTLTGVDEHRLNPAVIGSLRSSLRQVKDQSTRGSVLVTRNQGKFFSNGFDLTWAKSSAAFSGGSAYDQLFNLSELFRPLVADFVSLPMPTIAAVTGHAAAAGMMLVSSHDYVLMRSDRGVLYMSELDMGKCPLRVGLVSFAG